jgi:hypothetical protein
MPFRSERDFSAQIHLIYRPLASLLADNLRVSETPRDRHLPEVGSLSSDGSRMWDGKFWVRNESDLPFREFPPPVMRPAPDDLWSERRGFRLGSVVLAATVCLVISFVPIPAPNPGSLEGALGELAVVTLLRFLFAFGAVVVILSVGHQGIDVLLLRAMLTAFILGAAFVGFILSAVFLAPIPTPVTPNFTWLLAVIRGGLAFAVLVGPVIAVLAALANLLWYRSFRSLRPQLGVFNRRPRVV